jgi:outer membrane immunogenic protein
MRKALAAATALLALGLAAPAIAADLEPYPAYKAPAPVVPVFTWSGFYLGGNVGGYWASDGISTVSDVGLPAAAMVDAVSGVTLNPRGLIGGGQVGYNWSGIGGVFGIEIDADWLGSSASRALIIPGVGTLSDSSQANFLSTYRLRWGIPYQRVLFYGTLGFAVGTLKFTDTMAQIGGVPLQTVATSTTKAGFVAGGGIDFAITDNWWLRGEYLYVQMGHVLANIPATAPGALDDILVTHKFSESIARFALNYRISGSGM